MEQLRALRGCGLRQLMRNSDQLPESPGVYVWRYWPSFKSLDSDDILETLKSWCAKQPTFIETTGNSRIETQITRFPFGRGNSNTILGIDIGSAKGTRFLIALQESEQNRELLISILDSIVCLSQPIYVGKADNIKLRLEDHLARRSDLLNDIEQQKISFEDVYISFILDPVSTADNTITTTLEEILQRLTNPPLTKRIG